MQFALLRQPWQTDLPGENQLEIAANPMILYPRRALSQEEIEELPGGFGVLRFGGGLELRNHSENDVEHQAVNSVEVSDRVQIRDDANELVRRRRDAHFGSVVVEGERF